MVCFFLSFNKISKCYSGWCVCSRTCSWAPWHSVATFALQRQIFIGIQTQVEWAADHLHAAVWPKIRVDIGGVAANWRLQSWLVIAIVLMGGWWMIGCCRNGGIGRCGGGQRVRIRRWGSVGAAWLRVTVHAVWRCVTVSAGRLTAVLAGWMSAVGAGLCLHAVRSRLWTVLRLLGVILRIVLIIGRRNVWADRDDQRPRWYELQVLDAIRLAVVWQVLHDDGRSTCVRWRGWSIKWLLCTKMAELGWYSTICQIGWHQGRLCSIRVQCNQVAAMAGRRCWLPRCGRSLQVLRVERVRRLNCIVIGRGGWYPAGVDLSRLRFAHCVLAGLQWIDERWRAIRCGRRRPHRCLPYFRWRFETRR